MAQGSDLVERLVHPAANVMRIDAITIGVRHRVDMGDIDGLARSIADVGLLHPVVVTPDGVLISGARRIAACRQLGWEEIPITVVSLDEIIRGESAENGQRKDFTPSEAVAIGRALEERVREKARERQGRRTDLEPSGLLPEGSGDETRDIVGRAVGMSGTTYQRAKAVVVAAESDPATFGPILAEMDSTGKVLTAFTAVKAVRATGGSSARVAAPQGRTRTREAVTERHARIVTMARDGFREESIAQTVGLDVRTVRAALHQAGVKTLAQKLGKTAVLNANRTMEGIVTSAEPSTVAVRSLEWSALDRARFGDWDTRLSQAIDALTGIRRRLRGEMNGH